MIPISTAPAVRPCTQPEIEDHTGDDKPPEGPLSLLERKKRATPPTPRKLDGAKEAELTKIACSKPINGRFRWTLQLLAEQLVTLKVVDSISAETAILAWLQLLPLVYQELAGFAADLVHEQCRGTAGALFPMLAGVFDKSISINDADRY